MHTVTLNEAQQNLAELVRDLPREGEFLITDGDRPIARVSAVALETSLRQIEPKSVGTVLRPFPSPDDDMLGEMLDARQ